MAEEPEIKKTRHRSPNYPVIGLPKSLERAQEFFDAYKRAQVPVSIIQQKWGYKPLSGVGDQTVAALRAFGLIDVEGEKDKRLAKLTDIAWKILAGHPDRQKLIHEVALRPSIYAELWEKYKADGLPPDEMLTHYLQWDRGFNPDAITAVIAGLRDTLSLARLDADCTIPESASDPVTLPKPVVPAGVALVAPFQEKPNMVMDTFTLDEGVIALQYPNSLSKESFEDLESWVTLQLKKIKRRVKSPETPMPPTE